MELIVWILSLVAMSVGALLAYKKLTANYNFWKKQNVPFVPPKLIVGSMEWKSMKKPLQEIETEWYKRYGRVYGRFEATSPVLCVGDPEILENILRKDFQVFPNRRDMKFHDPVMDNTLFVLEGQAWLRVRNIVTPGFTTKKLKGMLPLLDDCCNLLVERFSDATAENTSIKCQEFYGAFVLSAIAQCAFGMNIHDIRNPKNIFVQKSKKLFNECFAWRSYLTILCPALMKVFRLNLLNPETTSFYRDIIIQVLEERKKHHSERDDFLQLMIKAENSKVAKDVNNNGADTVCEKGSCNINIKPEAEKENGQVAEDANNNGADTTCEKGNSEINNKPQPENPTLTHDEMLAQCVTFFIAGFDATTSLLSHITYRLAKNRGHQRKAVGEVEAALQNHDGELSYYALKEMPFLDAMMYECLRMCPAMVRHERRAEQDYVIESKKIFVKKGTIISIPVYAMHHDAKFYEDPEEFKPERFYSDEFKLTKSFNYLPFGNGRRMCVGMRFVLLQVKLCIAKILTKFEIVPAASTPESLDFVESRNVLTVNKVEVCLKERQLN